jgi:hypothetical protein
MQAFARGVPKMEVTPTFATCLHGQLPQDMLRVWILSREKVYFTAKSVDTANHQRIFGNHGSNVYLHDVNVRA